MTHSIFHKVTKTTIYTCQEDSREIPDHIPDLLRVRRCSHCVHAPGMTGMHQTPHLAGHRLRMDEYGQLGCVAVFDDASTQQRC